MDDNAALQRNKTLRQLTQIAEEQLERDAAVCLVSSRALITPHMRKVQYIPNAFDCSTAPLPVPTLKANPEEIIFGYVGTVDFWFDFAAIDVILQADKRHKVVIIGNNNMPQCEGVTYINRVPKGEVYGYMQQFNYCLYPFLKNKLLDTIDPVKIYEYLAFNKPTIAVRSLETERFAPLLSLYDDAASLHTLLAALPSPPPFGSEVERQVFIERNSWRERMRGLELENFNL